jgi:hypothetical protein
MKLALSTLAALVVATCAVLVTVLWGRAAPRSYRAHPVEQPNTDIAVAPDTIPAAPPDDPGEPASPPVFAVRPPKSPARVDTIGATPPTLPDRTLSGRVNQAIDRGVAYLRNVLKQMPEQANSASLVGLALLECDVSADDPQIVALAESLRRRDSGSLQTYELALHILFFDRLGKAQDEPLIRLLAGILRQNQFDNGTWSYRQAIRPSRQLNVPYWKAAANPTPEPSGDHSNTQFGALALWVAGRHGVGVQDNLARTDDHFRKDQNAAGIWGYRPGSDANHDSMTCAALMCLAMGHVLHQKDIYLREDPTLPKRQVIIARGFYALGQSFTRLIANSQGRLGGASSNGQIYFLWSLERLAVSYNIKTIAKIEWYPWAARLLVDSQRPDGSWQDAFPGAADTSFALLILKRSNRASDLAVMMRQTVNQKSLTLLPGVVELEPDRQAPPTPDLRKPLPAPDLRKALPAPAPRQALPAPDRRPAPELRDSDTRKAAPK